MIAFLPSRIPALPHDCLDFKKGLKKTLMKLPFSTRGRTSTEWTPITAFRNLDRSARDPNKLCQANQYSQKKRTIFNEGIVQLMSYLPPYILW